VHKQGHGRVDARNQAGYPEGSVGGARDDGSRALERRCRQGLSQREYMRICARGDSTLSCGSHCAVVQCSAPSAVDVDAMEAPRARRKQGRVLCAKEPFSRNGLERRQVEHRPDLAVRASVVHLCVCTFLTVLTCTWTIRGKASKVPEPLGYNVITEVCALRSCADFLRLEPAVLASLVTCLTVLRHVCRTLALL
jgi:hypothetical protein